MADKGGSGGQKSSGPGPTDPGIGGAISGAGGGSGSVVGSPVVDASTGFTPTGSTVPTAGSTIAGAPSVPQLFGINSAFGGDPGAGVPNTGGVSPTSPATASLGTPGGLTTSAAPAATAPVSPVGAPGVGSPAGSSRPRVSTGQYSILRPSLTRAQTTRRLYGSRCTPVRLFAH